MSKPKTVDKMERTELQERALELEKLLDRQVDRGMKTESLRAAVKNMEAELAAKTADDGKKDEATEDKKPIEKVEEPKPPEETKPEEEEVQPSLIETLREGCTLLDEGLKVYVEGEQHGAKSTIVVDSVLFSEVFDGMDDFEVRLKSLPQKIAFCHRQAESYHSRGENAIVAFISRQINIVEP